MWDMEQSLIILVDPTSDQNNSWCSAIKESREDFCGICHLYIFAKWSVGDFSSAFPFPLLHLSRMHNSLCPFSSFSGFVFSKPRRVASLVHACFLPRNLNFRNILQQIHFHLLYFKWICNIRWILDRTRTHSVWRPQY